MSQSAQSSKLSNLIDQSISAPQLLLVDDDESFVSLESEFLKREFDEVKILTALGGAEGLDILETTDVDSIISDFDMPGMDGLEFLRKVRVDHPDLPFVLFTGKGSEEIASEAISEGVTDYLQKGGGKSKYAVLANRVSNAIESSRTKEELKRQTLLFKNVQELADVGGWELDLENERLYWTDNVRSILEVSQDFELTQENVFELYHPDDREMVNTARERAINEGVPMELTARFISGEDNIRWMRIYGEPRKSSSGTVTHLVGAVQDVTNWIDENEING